ncbi:MAG TPA: hypothetical protein P5254_19520, partial [Aquihabitans sp.]|nr:hypothetical protein [Aquihabitans sp.]
MTAPAATAAPGSAVPRPAGDRGRSIGWWGVVGVIATEATIFASLLGAYFYVRATSASWPQGGIEAPELRTISIFTVLLLSSSAPLFVAERAMARGHLGRAQVAMAVTFV